MNFSARRRTSAPDSRWSSGTVYIALASHEDSPPWYGWVIGYTYNGGAFTQTAVLNVGAEHRARRASG